MKRLTNPLLFTEYISDEDCDFTSGSAFRHKHSGHDQPSATDKKEDYRATSLNAQTEVSWLSKDTVANSSDRDLHGESAIATQQRLQQLRHAATPSVQNADDYEAKNTQQNAISTLVDASKPSSENAIGQSNSSSDSLLSDSHARKKDTWSLFPRSPAVPMSHAAFVNASSAPAAARRAPVFDARLSQSVMAHSNTPTCLPFLQPTVHVQAYAGPFVSLPFAAHSSASFVNDAASASASSASLAARLHVHKSNSMRRRLQAATGRKKASRGIVDAAKSAKFLNSAARKAAAANRPTLPYMWRCAKCLIELPALPGSHRRISDHLDKAHGHLMSYFCKICQFGGTLRSVVSRHIAAQHGGLGLERCVGRNAILVRKSSVSEAANKRYQLLEAAAREETQPAPAAAPAVARRGTSRRTVTIVDITSLRKASPDDTDCSLFRSTDNGDELNEDGIQDPPKPAVPVPVPAPVAAPTPFYGPIRSQLQIKAPLPVRKRPAPTMVSPHSMNIASSTSSMSPRRHKESKQQPVLLACDLCPFLTRNPADFKGHVNAHTPAAPRRVRCPECAYWARNVEVIKRHTIVHRPDYYDWWIRKYFGRSLRSRIEAIEESRRPLEQQRAARHRELEQQASRIYAHLPPVASTALAFLPTSTSTASDANMLSETTKKKKRTTISIREETLPTWSAAEHELQSDTLQKSCPDAATHNSMVQHGTPTLDAQADRLRPRELKKRHGARGRKHNPDGSGVYKCERCPYSSRFAARITRHKAQHGLASCSAFYCRYCDYGAADQAVILMHEKLHAHTSAGNECDSHASAVVGALRIYKRCAPHAAVTGDRVNVYENAAAGPLDQSGQNSPFTALHVDRLPDGALRCPRCPFTHDDRVALLRHLSRHGPSHSASCPFCDYAIVDVADAQQHVALHVGHISALYEPCESRAGRHTIQSVLEAVRQQLAPVTPRAGVDLRAAAAAAAAGDIKLVCSYCDRADFADASAYDSHVQAHRFGATV